MCERTRYIPLDKWLLAVVKLMMENWVRKKRWTYTHKVIAALLHSFVMCYTSHPGSCRWQHSAPNLTISSSPIPSPSPSPHLTLTPSHSHPTSPSSHHPLPLPCPCVQTWMQTQCAFTFAFAWECSAPICIVLTCSTHTLTLSLPSPFKLCTEHEWECACSCSCFHHPHHTLPFLFSPSITLITLIASSYCHCPLSLPSELLPPSPHHLIMPPLSITLIFHLACRSNGTTCKLCVLCCHSCMLSFACPLPACTCGYMYLHHDWV